MRLSSRKWWAGLVALCLGTTLTVSAATTVAATGDSSPGPQSATQLQSYWQDSSHSVSAQPVLKKHLLAKAAPDECFAGVGQPYPKGTYDSKGRLHCPPGSQPKVNQAYVWGLTKTGDDLWFGTGPNILCLVFGSYLQTTTPIQNDSWVCEGEKSTYRTTWTPGVTLPASLGDFRPPDLFVYDQHHGKLTKLNSALDAAGQARLHATLGIRSAGSIGDRVFFAGPAIPSGLNVFVFDTHGKYIGSENLPGFSNIRKWVEVNGQLYTGVRQGNGGAVLRYTGSTTADPFQYEIVGNLTSEPAELADFEGRLFVSTWPAATMASLWMSPYYGSDKKLTASDAAGWQMVWKASDYEPDPVTAGTYGGGALASYGGKLYWGTMHVPMTAALAHAEVYGSSTDNQQLLANILGSNRAISIFRGDDFGKKNQHVDLLYGETKLPVYDGTTKAWTLKPNNMGVAPKYGHSGFGNVFNNYTWTMGVFKGQLYVGTMDWSYLLAKGLQPMTQQLGLPPDVKIPFPTDKFGADLWRFPSPDKPAVAESLNGVGNYTSYGIRTMVSDDALYLGMANPMNLLTDPTDNKPEGGWELIRLDAQTPPGPPKPPVVTPPGPPKPPTPPVVNPPGKDTVAPVLTHAMVVPRMFDISRDHRVKFSVKVSEKSYVRFVIKRKGHVVRSFAWRLAGPGLVTKSWNGRTASGHLAHNGWYTLLIKARDLAGNTSWKTVTFHVTR